MFIENGIFYISSPIGAASVSTYRYGFFVGAGIVFLLSESRIDADDTDDTDKRTLYNE